MKKHIILTILSVAAIFASCNGFEPKPVLPEGNGLILSLDSRAMVTKVDDEPALPAYETAIDHFDFFFFDDEEGTTPTAGMHARVTGASTQLATGTGEAYAVLRDGTHYVYILANYPEEISHSSDWKLEDLLALEFESKLVTEKKTAVNPISNKEEETGEVTFCENLVMDSYNEETGKYTVELTPTTIQEQREVTVGLSRIAAKMILTLNILEEVSGNLDGEKWTPVLKDIQAYYVNALNNKATVGATPVNRAELTDATSYDYLTYPSAYKLTKSEDSDYTFTLDPIYTYPQEWVSGDNGEPYFKVFLPWLSSKKGTSNFYYKIVVPKPADGGNTWTINRNTAYSVTATLTVVDSVDDYVLVDGKYTIYPWPAIGHDGGGPMNSAKFFDVPNREFTLYSSESISIPFSSSSAVSAYFTEISYWYYGSTNGTHYEFRFTDEPSNVTLPTDEDSNGETLIVENYDGVSSDAAKDLNPYSLTLDGKFIKFEHALTDIFTIRTIKLVIKNADGRSANVTITQHPAIEVAARPTKNAFLDGYYSLGEETVRDANGNLTGHVFTSSGNPYMPNRKYWRSGTKWSSLSSYTGENNYGSLYEGGSTSVHADHFFLTEVAVSAFTAQNNKYKVKYGSATGTTYTKEYRIGDPRVSAEDAGYTSETFVLPKYLYSDKAKRTKNDDGTYTQTTDPNGNVTYAWEEPLKILIGSQNNSDRNVIAPRLLVSSHMNITGGVNWNTSGGKGIVQRCAMYQEAGYPAGRWRLPTEAEFAFMMKLQADGTLPGLFAANCYYRMSDGRGIRISTADDGIPYTDDNKTHKFYIRMVYDLWYWGDDPTEGVEAIHTDMTPWELAIDPVSGEPNWKTYWAEYYHPNMHEH